MDCRLSGRFTFSMLWLKESPNAKLSRLGKSTFSRLRLKRLPKRKVRSVLGQLTRCKSWLNPPRAKLCRFGGKVTPSRRWLNTARRVKDWRRLGHDTLYKLRLNVSPRTKTSREPGKTISPKLWLNPPRVKLRRFCGKDTPCRSILKSLPKVKLWSLFGKLNPTRLWLNFAPKVKCWRLLGNFNSSKLWLKAGPKVNVWRLSGKVMHWSFRSPIPPKVKCCRPEFNSRLPVKQLPRTRSCKFGSSSRNKLWLNFSPKVKLRRLSGNFTSVKRWLKSSPNLSRSLNKRWLSPCLTSKSKHPHKMRQNSRRNLPAFTGRCSS